jgi:hypothetical protein
VDAVIAVGQRVVVNINGDWHYATVLGLDTGPRPGVELRFDYRVNDLETCYATHEEVRPLWVER